MAKDYSWHSVDESSAVLPLIGDVVWLLVETSLGARAVRLGRIEQNHQWVSIEGENLVPPLAWRHVEWPLVPKLVWQ